MELNMQSVEPAIEFFYPASELKTHIRRYRVINAPEGGPSWKGCLVKPRGGSVLIFNLGSPVRHKADDQSPAAMEGDFLVGSLARRVRITSVGGLSLFAVEFRPCGLYPFLSMPPVDVADFCIQTEEVWELHGLGLSDRMHKAAAEPRDLIQAFESFLTKRMAEFRVHSRMIEEAVELIRSSRGMVKVEELACNLRVGSRQLERKFAHRIGIPPKQLCRIVRLENVLTKLGSSTRELTSLALEGGYCDQAHFIHEFRYFTGKAPLAYLRGE